MNSYDSTNIRVTDLKVGFLFDYDLSTWEVTAEYEYDWGNNFYTREFKIVNGKEERYLSLEIDDDIKLSLYDKVNPLAIDRDLPKTIMRDDEPPREVSLGGVSYTRKEESIGYWRNVRSSDWSKFVSWDYEGEGGQKLLSIERWGEEEFEASSGIPIKEFEISNILPRENSPKRAPRDYEERKKKSKGVFWLLMMGLVLVFFAVVKCGPSRSSNPPRSSRATDKTSDSYSKSAIDQLIQPMIGYHSFSIILYDMDMTSSGWSKTYQHKYLIVSEKDSASEPEQTYTDWVIVKESFFRENENNLGMELAAKKPGGTVEKSVAPAGWGAYVGNEKYGKWETNQRGETFWSFYGKYMFFRTAFDLISRPVYRNYYGDYRSNYYGRSPYYGHRVGGSNYYGTNSNYTKKSRPDFFERKSQKNGFTQSRSSRSSRTSRSSSRYKGSSYRSRGGGFGK